MVNAGRYRVSYRIRTSAALLASTRVLLNGSQVGGLDQVPSNATDNWSGDAIVSASAGSTFSLQFFGMLGVAQLQGGTGASMVIERLS